MLLEDLSFLNSIGISIELGFHGFNDVGDA